MLSDHKSKISAGALGCRVNYHLWTCSTHERTLDAGGRCPLGIKEAPPVADRPTGADPRPDPDVAHMDRRPDLEVAAEIVRVLKPFDHAARARIIQGVFSEIIKAQPAAPTARAPISGRPGGSKNKKKKP